MLEERKIDTQTDTQADKRKEGTTERNTGERDGRGRKIESCEWLA